MVLPGVEGDTRIMAPLFYASTIQVRHENRLKKLGLGTLPHGQVTTSCQGSLASAESSIGHDVLAFSFPQGKIDYRVIENSCQVCSRLVYLNPSRPISARSCVETWSAIRSVLLFYSIENNSNTWIVDGDEPHEAQLRLLVENFNAGHLLINARKELHIVKSLRLA